MQETRGEIVTTQAMVVSGGGDIVMGQNPAWLDKINIYIKDGFSVHQGDLWAYRKAYRFTKWWLEQVGIS